LHRAVVETLESRHLLSAGQPDPTFGGAGIVTDNTLNAAKAVAVQSDGRVLVASSLPGSDGLDFSLARFNTDGTPDQSFGYHGRLVTDFGGIDMAGSIAIQSDGKIVVAGATVPANTDGQNLVLARYNSNGTLDNTFGTGGKELVPGTTHNDAEEKVLITATGQIVLGAYDFNQNTFEFFQFNSNGSLDKTFGSGGTVLAPANPAISTISLSDIALAPNGSIIAVGDVFPPDSPEQGFVERISSAGVIDPTTFTLPTGPGGSAFTLATADSVAVQSNGQIVVSGFDNISSNGNIGSDYITRFNQNGTVDNLFGTAGITTQSATSTKPTTVLIEANGKIDLTGITQVTTGSTSSPVFFAERFTSGGQLDSSFGNGGETLVNLHHAVDTSSAVLSPNGNIIEAGGNSAASILDIVRYTTDAAVTPPATHVPNAPFNLLAKPISSTQIDLTWSQNNNGPAIAGYKVLDGKGNVLTTLPSTASTYQAINLTPGTQYTFEVISFNSAGVSSIAGPVTAMTNGSAPVGPASVPYAPFNLTALVVSSSEIDLKWIDNNNGPAASDYQVFSDGKLLVTIPGNPTSYSITQLPPSTTHQYTVQAVNSIGPSSLTGPVIATTLPAGG
jgi:uncharacterized delta-60 repeat protein